MRTLPSTPAAVITVPCEDPVAVVAMASSAGGIQALGAVLLALGEGFPAPIVVVQHLDPKHRSLLAEVLCRQTRLKVRQAIDGDRLSPGTVLLAPPNWHLLVNHDGTVSLTQTARVQFVRPSADVLFESLAASFAERAIAVVLTGSGTDGAKGVRAIKTQGGTVIVQDPKSAQFTGMPQAAAMTEQADHIVDLEAIPALLRTVVDAKAVHGRRSDH